MSTLPYRSNIELPESVRNVLPKQAQDVYRSAFNFADKKYPDWSESRKSQYAWGAVKTRFEKRSNGRWVKLDIEDMKDLSVNAIIFPELSEWSKEYPEEYTGE